jgi:flagellar biosynthetic protein FliP
MSMTCFTRLLIVMHFLRQSLGLQGVPSNQILLGLSLFLTLFIMQPVGEKINERALQPLLDGKIGYQEAYAGAIGPLREFMLKYAREKDLLLFLDLAKQARPTNPGDIPTQVLAPAFLISELKTAFQIGFLMFLPFLVIDLVVSSILLSMGMMQLPPIVISTPFKILLFVMVDGWNLVVTSLVRSFY